MLHSLAFAPREALEGDFVSTTREAFRVAHDISAYSLVALAREVAPLMTNGGSIVAMTYYGSQKVAPHYNVMGVAKASLEASARYLAYDLGPKNPGELHFGGGGANARRPGHQRVQRDA
jgi:enoyl-[acyl-carrier protein] reductase I